MNENNFDRFEAAKNLMRCFPRSFINYMGEFIAHSGANIYFNFDNCKSDLDVKCKVLAWFSRAAYKTAPYKTDVSNRELHRFFLDGINMFLDTSFSFGDMELIYTYLGNDINRPLTIKFIESGFDMQVLKEKAEASSNAKS